MASDWNRDIEHITTSGTSHVRLSTSRVVEDWDVALEPPRDRSVFRQSAASAEGRGKGVSRGVCILLSRMRRSVCQLKCRVAAHVATKVPPKQQSKNWLPSSRSQRSSRQLVFKLLTRRARNALGTATQCTR